MTSFLVGSSAISMSMRHFSDCLTEADDAGPVIWDYISSPTGAIWLLAQYRAEYPAWRSPLSISYLPLYVLVNIAGEVL